MTDSLRKFYQRAGDMPEGWYDPETQMRAVTPGLDPRSAVSRMVSNHEIYHSHLATTTGFGTVSILVGALVQLGHREMEPLFNALISSSLLCHEEYATVSSIFVSGDGDFDRSLLAGYSIYEDYLAEWDGLLDLAPNPILAQIAIENLTRAAMQGGIDQELTAVAPEVWHRFHLPENSSPSVRLNLLRSPGFLKTLFRTVPEFQGGELILADRLRAGDLEPDEARGLLRSETGQGFLDAFGHLYFRLARNRLQSLELPCLSFNGHSKFTEPLIAATHELAGMNVRLPFRRPYEDESYLDQISAELAQEYLILKADPNVAVFADIEDVWELGPDFLLGGQGDKQWVQLIALPKKRLKAQYLFEDESAADIEIWPDDPVTCIRRRIRDEDSDEIKHVEIFGIRSIETLQRFAARWGELGRVTASTSILAMQSDAWLQSWLPVFRGIGPVPVLVDSDPFALMRRWKAAGMVVQYHRLSVGFVSENGEDAQKVEVFAWQVDTQQLLFFCPVSGVLSGALENYARSLGETFTPDGKFLEEAKDVLLPTISHLLQEERQFGFGWSIDF